MCSFKACASWQNAPFCHELQEAAVKQVFKYLYVDTYRDKYFSHMIYYWIMLFKSIVDKTVLSFSEFLF